MRTWSIRSSCFLSFFLWIVSSISFLDINRKGNVSFHLWEIKLIGVQITRREILKKKEKES